ncbi:MAG: hypothetical protein U9N54_00800 [candidate division Zixibacteria bacterium]|nr:hypothetical protein [candidate division Zixibacteria bacterium]
MKTLIIFITALFLIVGCSSEKKSEQTSDKKDQLSKANVEGQISNIQNTEGGMKANMEITYTPSEIPFDLNGKPVEIGGVKFTPATQWTDYGGSGMRIASYSFGPLEKETDSAIVTVFYFGKGQGGDVDSNLERWINQMALMDGRDPHTAAIQYKLDVDGMTVHMLSLFGIYKSSMGGSMSGKSEDKENYRMVGSIVETPEGNVFFKLTGPDYTAKIMIEAYMAMIKQIKKI